MNRLSAVLLVLVLVAVAHESNLNANADGGSQDGASGNKAYTCGWWRSINGKTPDATTKEVMRIMFAQGIIVGLRAEPIGAIATVLWGTPSAKEAAIRALDLDSYGKGVSVIFQGLNVLLEGFDVKCGDYRNESVRLDDLTVIVASELGGVQANRVEEALRVLRSGGTSARQAMLAVLRGR